MMNNNTVAANEIVTVNFALKGMNGWTTDQFKATAVQADAWIAMMKAAYGNDFIATR